MRMFFDECRDVGHMLDHFEADDGVEGLAVRDEVFGGCGAIVDGETLGFGVRAGDGDVFARRDRCLSRWRRGASTVRR